MHWRLRGDHDGFVASVVEWNLRNSRDTRSSKAEDIMHSCTSSFDKVYNCGTSANLTQNWCCSWEIGGGGCYKICTGKCVGLSVGQFWENRHGKKNSAWTRLSFFLWDALKDHSHRCLWMSGGDGQNALCREIDTNFGHGGLTIMVPNHAFLAVGKRMDGQNLVKNYAVPDCVRMQWELGAPPGG